MDLIYTNREHQDIGVLKNPQLDLAFGRSENNFECKIPYSDAYCEKGSLIYAEGTEYGGIVDSIGIDTRDGVRNVIYSGRTWHGILGSKVILPLQQGEATVGGKKLPDGCVELEYIASTGTQYFDLEFVPTENTEFEVTFQLINPDTTNQCIFGVVGQFSLRWYGSQGCFRSNGGNNTNFPAEIDKYSVHTAVKSATKCTIDDVYSVSNTAGNVSTSLYLCAQHDADGARNLSQIKILSAFRRENGTMMNYYVPILDPSGVACMYDRIGNKAYYNAGSGSFTAGPAVEGSGSSGGISYSENVNVEGETADGESLVDRYLILSGDANACIEYVLNRIGLPSALFVPSADESGVMISKYQFARYVDAYTGLCDMLASVGMRLQIVHEDGFVMLSAVPAIDYSQTQEFEAALIPYETKKYLNKPNHLVCLGSGELENRIVVHLYMDADGNISETPTFSALDDYTAVYDYPNAASGEDVTEEEQRQDLIASGTERLLELQHPDTIDIDFDITDDAYYIGDIIGTYDQETGLFVSALIYKKIVTFKNGRVNVYYNEG